MNIIFEGEWYYWRQASSHDTTGSALSTIDSSSETLLLSSDPSPPSANQSKSPRPLEASLLPSSDPLNVDCAGGLLAEHLAPLNKLILVLPIIDRRGGPLKRINEVKNILHNDNPNEKDFVIALGGFMGSIDKNMNINPTEENTVKILKFLEHEFNSEDHIFSRIFEVLQRTTFGEKIEEEKPLCLNLDRIQIIHRITNADDSRCDPRLLWLLYNPYTPDQANIPEGRGVCTHNGYCYNVEIILLCKGSPLEHAEHEFVIFRRK